MKSSPRCKNSVKSIVSNLSFDYTYVYVLLQVQSADHTGCDHLSLNDLMKLVRTLLLTSVQISEFMYLIIYEIIFSEVGRSVIQHSHEGWLGRAGDEIHCEIGWTKIWLGGTNKSGGKETGKKLRGRKSSWKKTKVNGGRYLHIWFFFIL